MKRFALHMATALALFVALPAASDTLPTLNDILNTSQLDVRSSSTFPATADTAMLEVRAESPLRQMFRTGDNVTRLAKVAVWVSDNAQTWTPEKSLVLRIYAGQDFTHILAQAEEPFARTIWGGPLHVFTLNCPIAPLSEYTFELTVGGGSRLTGAALARLPYDTGVGPLSSNGETLSGALWFETLVKRRSDLDVLYSQVFSRFDLIRADLSVVKRAVAQRDWAGAKQALVAHFDGRPDAVPHMSAQSKLSDASRRSLLADANLVTQHRLRTADGVVDLGPRWNWYACSPADAMVQRTEGQVRRLLAEAYTQYHRESYARTFDEMLRYEFEDFPSPLRGQARPQMPFGESDSARESTWSPGAIAAQLQRGLADYRAFRNSISFRLDTRFAFIANLAEMSDVFNRAFALRGPSAQNRSVLFEIGTAFPEFRNLASVRAPALVDALQECVDSTFPDGPLREESIASHRRHLDRYLRVLESAARSPTLRRRVTGAARDRVERMSDYLLYSTMPNGWLPSWGDTDPPQGSASLLLRSANLFGRNDMRWVATGGKTGAPPNEASAAFPDAGYFYMRSGWSPDAAFIGLHNGSSVAHGHNDANGIVMTAFGNELLIDPGAGIDGSTSTRLLSNSVSHNTVTMDDQNTVNAAGESLWISGWWGDIYDGSNAGYEASDDAKARHRRTVVFVKPSTFFIVDSAAGDRPHDWALRSHFAPGALDTASTGASLTFHATSNPAYPGRGRGGLRIWAAPTDDNHLTSTPGPVSGGAERQIEAPVAVWSQFQTRTATWAQLLEPFAVSPSPLAWDVRQDGHGTAMATQGDSHTRRYLLIRPGSDAPLPDAWVESTGFSTDATVSVYLHRTADRAGTDFRRLILTSASLFLQTTAEIPAFVHADQQVVLLEVTWQGDTMTVHRVGGAGIAVRTFGARRLVLNGKSLAIAAGRPIVRLPDSTPR